MSRAALAVLAILALVAAASGVTSSGADFTASAPSPGNSFTAAADFNTVAVALTDPGTPLRGTVGLQAGASSGRGVQSVQFQSSPAGSGSWTDACQDSSAPYSCDWDSSAVADGPRDLRALATDLAGYQRASTVIGSRLIDNTLPATALTDPGYLRGTETLTATASDAGSGLASLELAYRPAGGSWTTLCSGAGSPRSCPLATAGLADGAHELRARATDAAGNVRETLLTRTVDNTTPSVSVVVPPAPLRGTVTVDANAEDGAGSGIKQITEEYRTAGAGAWAPLCVDSLAPYSCTGVDTTLVADGLYDLRAVAEDNAGFITTSGVIAVRIDNAAPPVPTLNSPGTNLQGSVALGGTATDAGSGIAAWIVQYRPAGSAVPWADACSDTSAPSPYGCSWSTTSVADALYDLRAVARDQAGNETPSATLTNRRIDNNGPAVTLTDPGAYLRGTVALSATATDPAGVQSVIFERKLSSGGGWTTICTDIATPFTCSFNTTGVADGTYDIQARAIDTLTHTNSSTATARQVDNTAPAAFAVDSGNGGSTAGRLEAGDWLRLTWSEPIAPASVLAGWDGSPQAVRVELRNAGTQDQMNFWNGAGTTRLNLVDSAANLALRANFVTSNGWFNATMTRSGASFTITLGTQLAGTLATAAAANMRWTTSILATDLAGNAASSALLTESAPTDLDF